MHLRDIYIPPFTFLILLAILLAIPTSNSFAQDKNYIAFSSAVFDEGGRIGISFNHISNASLGVENPGVESLAVTYIIPL